MKGIRSLVILIVIISWMSSDAQLPEKVAKPVPDSFCVSGMEYKLYTMINAYRQRYELPPIPLSKSLCYVASEHVKDLFFHHPDKGSCNAHSWSDQGNWKPFCYPRDENKKNSVWDKPKELTPYKGKGFEIVYWENSPVVIDSIIALWKSMDYFNSFLMNTGKWQGKKWNAIGIGIHENYACAWFGELPDPEGEPLICGQEPQPTVSQPKEIAVKKEKKEPAKEVKEGKDVAKTEAAVPAENVRTTVPEISHEIPVAGAEHYYIIVKGVAPEKELQRYLNELLLKGYSTARLVEKNGKQRVSIMEFQEKSLADRALKQVKKIWEDAWILKK
jgi:hypothetical protein